jgi:glutathione S-transferase
MAPGTCARVPCILLEAASAQFETRLIRFLKGEHKSPAYKAINPQGKVPALQIDNTVLTENPAIIYYLHQRFPEAALLPTDADAKARAVLMADLSFCASTLHPIVTRIRLPHFFAGEQAARAVWENACKAMDEYFQLIETRLVQGPWWYGNQWSALDAYLYWIFWRVEGAGYDVKRFPKFGDHKLRSEARPAVKRALAREAQAQAILEQEGLAFVPPPVPG